MSRFAPAGAGPGTQRDACDLIDTLLGQVPHFATCARAEGMRNNRYR
jgi:hypothetical protein